MFRSRNNQAHNIWWRTNRRQTDSWSSF